jgi:hypothetical protein
MLPATEKLHSLIITFCINNNACKENLILFEGKKLTLKFDDLCFKFRNLKLIGLDYSAKECVLLCVCVRVLCVRACVFVYVYLCVFKLCVCLYVSVCECFHSLAF